MKIRFSFIVPLDYFRLYATIFNINPELKCRERRAGDGPRAPAIDEENSQNRERNEKHESNANTISAEESAVADSGGGHGSEPAADLGLRVG